MVVARLAFAMLPRYCAPHRSFSWSVQHCAMPLLADLRFVLWREINFFPVVLIVSIIFIRTRRLLPLIVAQWLGDAVAVLVTTLLPLLRR